MINASLAGKNLVIAADAAAQRTLLELVPGTDVQAYSATLAAVAGGTYTGASSITTLGTIATGVWNGTTIAVANGGTGATDASTARTNLGLGTIATQAASAVAVTGGTITGLTNFGVSMANNTAITGIALGTITDTTSRPFNITQTWNNASLAATALAVNVTDTSSAAASYLLDLQVGGTSKARLTKSGLLSLAGSGSVNTLSISEVGGTGGIVLFNNDVGIRSSNALVSWVTSSSTYGFQLVGGYPLSFGSSGAANATDTFLRRGAAAVLQQGNDSATPVAQTLRAGQGTGTNIAGANYTLQSGNGTGTGGSGKLVFQTAPTGSSGTTANTMATALEIDKDRVVFVANTNAAPSGTPASGGYLYVESGALKFKGSSGTVTTIANA